MVIAIDFTLDEPIYRQIRTQIVRALANDELLPGDALPSVRSLARDLGVNMHTVNKAYAILRDEGYVHMRGRRGAFVADAAEQSSSAVAQVRHDQVVDDLCRIATELRAQGGSIDDFMGLAEQVSMRVFGQTTKRRSE